MSTMMTSTAFDDIQEIPNETIDYKIEDSGELKVIENHFG